MLNKQQVIHRLCAITGIVFHSRPERAIAPADCFCGDVKNIFHDCFQFDEEHLDFIHTAVVNELKRKGYEISNVSTYPPPE